MRNRAEMDASTAGLDGAGGDIGNATGVFWYGFYIKCVN